MTSNDSATVEFQHYMDERRLMQERNRIESLKERYLFDLAHGGLTLAFPSGKSTEENTIDLFKKANFPIERKHTRAALCAIQDLWSYSRAAFCKPSSIPNLIDRGIMPIGITGMDAVEEFRGTGTEKQLCGFDICGTLTYSRSTLNPTRCVLFVRNDDPIQTLDDFKKEFGSNDTVPEVATEYPSSTIKFLWSCGLRAHVFRIPGSIETLITLGAYRFGVALTETGTSLKINGLREVATVFESSMVILANGTYLEIPGAREDVDFLCKSLSAVLTAKENVYLVMNAPTQRIDEICALLPSLKCPTIQPLRDPNFCSIGSVVPLQGVGKLKRALSNCGAAGFVELESSSIM